MPLIPPEKLKIILEEYKKGMYKNFDVPPVLELWGDSSILKDELETMSEDDKFNNYIDRLA